MLYIFSRHFGFRLHIHSHRDFARTKMRLQEHARCFAAVAESSSEVFAAPRCAYIEAVNHRFRCIFYFVITPRHIFEHRVARYSLDYLHAFHHRHYGAMPRHNTGCWRWSFMALVSIPMVSTHMIMCAVSRHGHFVLSRLSCSIAPYGFSFLSRACAFSIPLEALASIYESISCFGAFPIPGRFIYSSSPAMFDASRSAIPAKRRQPAHDAITLLESMMIKGHGFIYDNISRPIIRRLPP